MSDPVTPWAVAYQAPPSMEFSRQEYWSGVPLPSPESLSVVSNSLPPQGLYSPWNSPGLNTGVGSFSLLQGIFPTQGSNSGLSHSRWILLPAEPQGKPKNTGVGILSLLQRIFLTQELKLGVLHCWWILYQLSYQGSLGYSRGRS